MRTDGKSDQEIQKYIRIQKERLYRTSQKHIRGILLLSSLNSNDPDLRNYISILADGAELLQQNNASYTTQERTQLYERFSTVQTIYNNIYPHRLQTKSWSIPPLSDRENSTIQSILHTMQSSFGVDNITALCNKLCTTFVTPTGLKLHSFAGIKKHMDQI